DEALGAQLAGGRVDDRIAGRTVDPRLPRARIAPVREAAPRRLERRLEQLGPIPQRAVREFAPEELLAKRRVRDGIPRGARRERAELQILREPARAREVHAVARGGVAVRDTDEAQQPRTLSGLPAFCVLRDSRAADRLP